MFVLLFGCLCHRFGLQNVVSQLLFIHRQYFSAQPILLIHRFAFFAKTNMDAKRHQLLTIQMLTFTANLTHLSLFPAIAGLITAVVTGGHVV
ncbi:Uncharacterised protein [Vibrio cholerae]|nr:Uncharacterised protein [Vibrio cholerae]